MPLFLFMIQENYLQFFTATILEWKHLLQNEQYKQLILDSLSFLVKTGRVRVFGFVIMINHIHLIWQIGAEHRREDVQRDFLKYTGQMMKVDLKKHHPHILEHFFVNAKDRKYQIWERNAYSFDIWSRRVAFQKLGYIHKNPVRAGVCRYATDYPWSSARFYYTGVDNFGWLTHLMD